MQDGGGGPCMIYIYMQDGGGGQCMVYAGRWRWAVYDVCRMVEVGRV